MNSVLLDAGADVIARNGFAPGDYYTEKRGGDGGYLPMNQCPVCPRGAIAIAAGCGPVDFAQGWHENWKDTVPRLSEAAAPAVRAAEQALAAFLPERWEPAAGLIERQAVDCSRIIERWADEEGRTQDQIVETMRAAAEHERGQGR
ncbi:DUF6197 family protein [Actinomadura nitritigenes]|uniref:DUF6197 family protein n=1 Tax=Actinomadura nitritigenes TaxID=134602 RepID=UPI003D8C3B7C